MIGEIGAALTSGLPTRTEHEVIDDELTFAAEQTGQAFLAVSSLEYVILLALPPRQFASLLAQRVARLGECFLIGKMCLASGDPFVVGNNLVRFHRTLL